MRGKTMAIRKILLLLAICSFISVSFPASYAVSQDKVVVIPLISGAKSPAYGNTTVVAKSGGDYTSPLDAINDRDAWCPQILCLMKIMPGEYDIGNNLLDRSNLEGSL